MGQDETELGQPELEQWAVSETEPRLLHGLSFISAGLLQMGKLRL